MENTLFEDPYNHPNRVTAFHPEKGKYAVAILVSTSGGMATVKFPGESERKIPKGDLK